MITQLWFEGHVLGTCSRGKYECEGCMHEGQTRTCAISVAYIHARHMCARHVPARRWYFVNISESFSLLVVSSPI